MEDQNNDYSSVIDTIANMFGDVITKDVIHAIVENYDGDLNLSVEAVMNMTSDAKNETKKPDEVASSSQMFDNSMPSTSNYAFTPKPECKSPVQEGPSSSSYAYAMQNRGAIPKQPVKPKTTKNATIRTDQIQKIISYHNDGARVLIILRGAPGAGKTYLAREIIKMTIGHSYHNYNTHIFSTDDFFMVRGQYQYDRYRLTEAHSWNRTRVKAQLINGLSPVIIDNTNIELWEMEPYVREGVANGYYIEVVEPSTNWAKKAHQLCKRNIHNVPLATIKRMLDNYQSNITGLSLRQTFELSYPGNLIPPVLRKISPEPNRDIDNPALKDMSALKLESDSSTDSQEETILQIKETFSQSEGDTEAVPEPQSFKDDSCDFKENSNDEKLTPQGKSVELNTQTPKEENNDEEILKQKFVLEAQKRLEELQQFEAEWENGESWDDESKSMDTPKIVITTVSPLNSIPKPPRKQEKEPEEPVISVNIMDSVNKCDDWSQISRFMPPWHDLPQPGPSGATVKEEDIPVEKISSSTCVESGDTDIVNNKNNFKILSTTPKDINLFHISSNIEKIPDKRKLDKSTLTYEHSIADAYRCKNEEQHFIAFRKMFKNVARPDLRDIFDKCQGDVNWAVDIVLDSMTNKLLETVDNEELSDVEEELLEQCDCLAAYNIIPDGISTSTKPNTIEEVPGPSGENGTIVQKKAKKDAALSESSIQLKRQIEQNVVISDNHYSPYCLKLRKMRHGEVIKPEETLESQVLDGQESAGSAGSSEASTASVDSSDDEESNAECIEEGTKVMNVNVGMEFITMLDEMFGRKDMIYPNSVTPSLTLSVSILNEINASWMESLMNQLESESKQMQEIVKQDEEFARELAQKEAELYNEGKEPAVPDFKEIMDMDFALSLYRKDLDEWRSKVPQDLAARLSRDKLYNLFPEVSQDVLSELLMAHDNNFQCTVESLLVSTGRLDILEKENGINQFVMEKELERSEKLLEEQKKALADEEWPLLPKGETATMLTVNMYRDEGELHLQRRNLNYQRAQEFIRRGMTQVATHYSTIASYHKLRFEQANSLAAAALIQVNAQNNPDSSTIDLHYMRVAEAKESLDIFLDTHITKLKENRSGPKYQHLFFITGRGLHSNGQPRIKPAVKKRLRERGLHYSERNPGLLTAKVCGHDKLAHQVPAP